MKWLIIMGLVLAAVVVTPAEAQAPGWVVFTQVTTASCPIAADPNFLGYTLQDFPAGNPSTVTMTAPDGTSVVCAFTQTIDMVNGQPITLTAPEGTPTVLPAPPIQPLPTDTPVPTDVPTDTPTPTATPAV